MFKLPAFKFKRFNPSNNLMIEVQNQQPEDSLKLTRIAIEKKRLRGLEIDLIVDPWKIHKSEIKS